MAVRLSMCNREREWSQIKVDGSIRKVDINDRSTFDIFDYRFEFPFHKINISNFLHFFLSKNNKSEDISRKSKNLKI